MNNRHDETISSSKSESILKALAILESDIKDSEKKPISRPDIPVGKTIVKHLFCICAFILCCFLVFHASTYLNIESMYTCITLIALGVIFLIVRFKRFCIDFVLLYQKLAPERIRRSCLFEPSCSSYMLLAIEKYGVIKGVSKGIRRLFRCHHPNGGVDYP